MTSNIWPVVFFIGFPTLWIILLGLALALARAADIGDSLTTCRYCDHPVDQTGWCDHCLTHNHHTPSTTRIIP